MKVRLYIAQWSDAPNINSLVFTDHSSNLIESSWNIRQKSGSSIDTIVLELHDKSRSLSFEAGQDVILEDFSNPTVRLFGGIIQQIAIVPLGIERLWRLESQDYTILAHKNTVRKTYDAIGQTDKSIIQDAFLESGLTEIDVSSKVQEGRVLDAINFQGSSLAAMLDEISTITGFVWIIDYHKRLHYHPRSFEAAGSFGVDFSDAPNEVSSFPFYSPSRTKTLATWNVVELQGSKETSNDITDIYSSNGVDKVFITGSQKGTSPIDRPPSTANPDTGYVTVEVNTGTDGSPIWTVKTVRLEEDTGAILGTNCDVLWNPLYRRLQFFTAPPNFATNSFRLKGRYLVDVIIQNEDTAAIATHGRRFKGSLIIPEVTDLRTAQDLAIAYLRENSDKEHVILSTDKDLQEPLCRTTRVTSTALGLTNALCLVDEVEISMLGGETAEWRLVCEVL